MTMLVLFSLSQIESCSFENSLIFIIPHYSLKRSSKVVYEISSNRSSIACHINRWQDPPDLWQ